jgi:phosphoribosyl-ATP pyrophosphohydrolase/phosphoribosyl-AMP cyclohydrolase
VAALLGELKLDSNGLVPVVAQDALTGEVRMLAYANREALELSLATGVAHFYSRSRDALWKKGETSGNELAVRAAFLDCDGDAVVLLVEPAGPTCHTGAPSCFFRPLDGTAIAPELRGPAPRPLAMLERLESVIETRAKGVGAERSYTRRLLEGGAAAIGAKLREEADELARAVAGESDARVASEAADVVFHLLVALRSRAVPWRAVLSELARRFGQSGLDEKAARVAPDEP